MARSPSSTENATSHKKVMFLQSLVCLAASVALTGCNHCKAKVNEYTDINYMSCEDLETHEERISNGEIDLPKGSTCSLSGQTCLNNYYPLENTIKCVNPKEKDVEFLTDRGCALNECVLAYTLRRTPEGTRYSAVRNENRASLRCTGDYFPSTTRDFECTGSPSTWPACERNECSTVSPANGQYEAVDGTNTATLHCQGDFFPRRQPRSTAVAPNPNGSSAKPTHALPRRRRPERSTKPFRE